jgi:hypothetical protein
VQDANAAPVLTKSATQVPAAMRLMALRSRGWITKGIEKTSVEPPSMAAGSIGYRQLGRLRIETPGFAPPPRDGYAFFDRLLFGTANREV